MNKGYEPSGFTIIEVLIVLAVGSFMFLAVNMLFSGDQAQTEFNTGVHEIYSSLQSINNEVEAQNYPITGYTCFLNNNGIPNFKKTTSSPGSDTGCVFIGKIINFNPYNNNNVLETSQYYVYSIVDKQFSDPSTLAVPSSLAGTGNDLDPYRVLNFYIPGTSNAYPPPGTQVFNFPYGFQVTRIYYPHSFLYTTSSPMGWGMVGFFNNITSNNNTNLTDELAYYVDSDKSYTVPTGNQSLKATAVQDIDYLGASIINPGPYSICLTSSIEPNMSAEITFQQASNSANLSLSIINNDNCNNLDG